MSCESTSLLSHAAHLQTPTQLARVLTARPDSLTLLLAPLLKRGKAYPQTSWQSEDFNYGMCGLG